jgi:hypothetical protein
MSAERIKSLLSQLPLVGPTYQTIGAARQVARHRITSRGYERRAAREGLVYSEPAVAAQVAARLRARGLVVTPRARGDIRTLWVGSLEPQDRLGTIQGLERFGEVVCLYNDGEYGAPKRVGRESEKYFLETAARMKRVDLVIGNMYGFNVHPETLLTLGRLGAVIANISMDDRHAYHGFRLPDGRWSGPAGLLPGLDLAATTTRDTCVNYLLEDTPALWFPMGSDPEIFRPRPDVKKDIDVTFIGARYGVRRQIVEHLRSGGVNVQAWGRDWDNGFLPVDRVPEIVARSRICLGVATIGHTWTLTSPKLRDYDMPMAGAFYLTQHSPDVVEHFTPSQEIETYRSLEECALKVRWYLDHPECAEAIGRAGRERCLRDHTWEARFAKLLKIVGLLP